MMVSANDLIALYLGLELQSLSLYVLAAFRRDTLRSSEAGLKYFVLGALSSGMLLYGCSLIYGFLGATGFDAIAAAVGGGDSVARRRVVGLVFLLAGLCFKVSAAPFHMWTPDVYEGAPTPVTALFSVAPKIAALALFIRVLMEPFGDLTDKWQQIIVVVAILSMAIGAFTAIVQENIKRLMAYSSIGHVGYALVGIATGTEEGVRAVLIYLAIYLFMNVGVFACILAMRQKGSAVENISDLAGFSKSRPLVAGIFAALMFSMAGIPPLAGFFGKFYVFMAAVNAGLVPLAVFGVLASVVGCYYYLRIVKVMYFDEAGEDIGSPAAFGNRCCGGIERCCGGSFRRCAVDDHRFCRRRSQNIVLRMSSMPKAARIRLFAYSVLGSTNDEARRLAKLGERGPLAVWTATQPGGRGRMGRSWAGTRGNLMTSLPAPSRPSACRGRLHGPGGRSCGCGLRPELGERMRSSSGRTMCWSKTPSLRVSWWRRVQGTASLTGWWSASA